MNHEKHFKYGTFINAEYKEFAKLHDAIEYFDTSVALGLVTIGSVIGWLDVYDYETLYNHMEVMDNADCHQRHRT